MYLLVGVLAVLMWCSPSVAGVLYSEKELWAAGELWTETRLQWQGEQAAHQRRLTEIEQLAVPEARKGALRRIELQRHHDRSLILAAKRDQVQNVLVNEANARVRGGKEAASGQLVDTAGTKFGEAGHRGMAGDRDMGGGERTVHKVKEVLKEMGIDQAATVKESAGTLEIGDDFELTINKDGARPRAGSEFHRIKAEVDARNPETYVSESMKSRSADGKIDRKQAGTDYVEIQDHRKKATAGLKTDGAGLKKSPEKAQKLAKGTVKTLEMANLDEETVNRILQQHGIEENPAAFRERLRGIKEGTIQVGSATDAEQLRRASEDIFNAAEEKALNTAKQEIVALREKAAALPANDPKRTAIEEEIVDSVTKMQATRAANEAVSGGKGSATTAKTGSKKNASGTGSAEAELAALDDLRGVSGRGKAVKAFGALMNIVDIGQTCQTIEDYVEGKIPLKEAATKVVDQYVTGGAIGTVEHASQSKADYSAAKSAIEQANRENMAAYLNAWEIALRKAGLAPAEARQYVASAMLAGNLEKLEDKAAALAAAGKTIKPPQLVVDTFTADDTLGERAQAVGEGIVRGAYESGKYLVTAPSRTVEAWAEGELKEADLDAYAKGRETESRVEMFRKLLNAGIDSQKALAALNEWEEGETGPLKELFQQARARQQEAVPTKEELAAVEEANKRIAAEEQRRVELWNRYAALVAYLRFAPLTLQVDPSPVAIKGEGQRSLVRLALVGPGKSSMGTVAAEIEQILAQLTGQESKVRLSYRFSCKGRQGATPHEWLTASPGAAGLYPVTATLVADIRGDVPGAAVATLSRGFERSETAPVEVEVSATAAPLTGEVWEIMKTTPNLVIDTPLQSFKATVSPAAEITFPVKYTLNDYLVEGKGSLRFSADGKMIEQLSIDTRSTDPRSGQEIQKDELRVGPFKLYAADKETPTYRAHLYYTLDREGRDTFGTHRYGIHDRGKFQWMPAQKLDRDATYTKTYIHFYMTEEAIQTKEQAAKQARDEKKKQQESVQQAAASGTSWAGPFGAEEGFDGSIKLDISLKDKVVSGSFRGEHKDGEKRKHVLSGEFQGVIDPESGEITAMMQTSSLWTFRLDKGKWYPATLAPESLAKETRLVGTLVQNRVSGNLLLDGRKGFVWSAVPVTEGGKQ